MCVCEKALFIRLWMLDYEVGFYSTSNLNPCIALYVDIFSSGNKNKKQKKKEVVLSLKFTLSCNHSPKILLELGLYNKTNIPCRLLFNIEIIHSR